MELLARAILICPKEYIEDCLDRWTTLETKLIHPELVQPDRTRVSGEHRGFLAMAADVARTAAPIIGGRNGSLEMEGQEGGGRRESLVDGGVRVRGLGLEIRLRAVLHRGLDGYLVRRHSLILRIGSNRIISHIY
jgi:hypothetical protein